MTIKGVEQNFNLVVSTKQFAQIRMELDLILPQALYNKRCMQCNVNIACIIRKSYHLVNFQLFDES